MTEPMLEMQAQSRRHGLWDQAPAWRNLTVAASLLTVAALTLPMVMPQTAQVTSEPVKLHSAPAVAPKISAVAPVPPARQAMPSAPTAPAAPSPLIAHVVPLPAASAHVVPYTDNRRQACTVQLPDAPIQMSGTVIGLIPHDQSVNIFHHTERASGGAVNPAYVDDVRVMVRPDPGTMGGSRNPVVPKGLKVQVGDHVTYQTPYRDPSMQCGFVPSQVTADHGAAAAPMSQVSAPPVQTASLPPAPSPGVTSSPAAAPAPATPSNVCLMVMPPSPTAFGRGMVMSFEDHATSLMRIQHTEANAGGKIDPDYIDNLRVTVRLSGGAYRVFLVPKTMQVHAGDQVMVQGGYRNLNFPCSYVPNLITADLGPAPNNAASVPAPQSADAHPTPAH